MEQVTSFHYHPIKRFGFLFLALFNIPVAYLALGTDVLPLKWHWFIWVLAAIIIICPLCLQLIGLARNMSITTSAKAIVGQNSFGRRVEIGWDEVESVFRMNSPSRGICVAIIAKDPPRAIIFASSIIGYHELIDIIKKNTKETSRLIL